MILEQSEIKYCDKNQIHCPRGEDESIDCNRLERLSRVIERVYVLIGIVVTEWFIIVKTHVLHIYNLIFLQICHTPINLINKMNYLRV